ncbi:MAG: DsrE family protein [Methanosarcinaceae archaeon]|nr:DsrE family protein [Methanosarcinaceae archaeon]MDF1533133.1 DsrE family protein [Methanosarcinaceae archaeon]
MKLGILLTTSPEHENTNTVIEISKSAIKQGISVSIFLMADGTHNSVFEPFQNLIEHGVEIILCAHNAAKRKVEVVENIVYGSQYDLATIIKESDRFISF